MTYSSTLGPALRVLIGTVLPLLMASLLLALAAAVASGELEDLLYVIPMLMFAFVLVGPPAFAAALIMEFWVNRRVANIRRALAWAALLGFGAAVIGLAIARQSPDGPNVFWLLGPLCGAVTGAVMRTMRDRELGRAAASESL